jgi:hypothetical protein
MKHLAITIALLVACSRTEPKGVTDAAPPPIDTAESADANETTCEVSGAPGTCVSLSECAALADHTSYPGHCPGAADIQCCITTPSVADNPPIPPGYKLMAQADVTPEMTTWAVEILNDPVTYPMFATTSQTFGTLLVLARVEWHPPDFQNSVVHRGVTLYEPS